MTGVSCPANARRTQEHTCCACPCVFFEGHDCCRAGPTLARQTWATTGTSDCDGNKRGSDRSIAAIKGAVCRRRSNEAISTEFQVLGGALHRMAAEWDGEAEEGGVLRARVWGRFKTNDYSKSGALEKERKRERGAGGAVGGRGRGGGAGRPRWPRVRPPTRVRVRVHGRALGLLFFWGEGEGREESVGTSIAWLRCVCVCVCEPPPRGHMYWWRLPGPAELGRSWRRGGRGAAVGGHGAGACRREWIFKPLGGREEKGQKSAERSIIL